MLVLAFVEGLLILASALVSIFLCMGETAYTALFYRNGLMKSFMIVIIFQLSLYYNDLYDTKMVKNQRELFICLLKAFGLASILLALIYYLNSDMATGQGVFVLSILLSLFVLSLWRLLFNKINHSSKFKENVVILGSGDIALKCAKEMDEHSQFGFNVVAFVDDNLQLPNKMVPNSCVVEKKDNLPSLIDKYKVSRIVVALEDRRNNLPFETLLKLKLNGIRIEEAASVYEKMSGKIYIENLRPSWLIFSEGFSKSKTLIFSKRLFDMVFSVLGIAISLPIAFVIALLIKLDSKGPIFFKQERVGQYGRIFNIIKFRSMYVDAEKNGPVWAQDNDTRVTRVGRYLRLVRLDEIPQFVNVLRGDMSFVGPRPERPYFVDQLSQLIPYFSQRHTVKPGITGWAQIKHHYTSTTESAIEKLKYDLFYVKNMSISLDILILLLTVKVVLFGIGAK